MADISPILAAIAECATCKTDRNDLGKVVVEAIHQRLSQAGWTGIYWLEDDELVLGPFVGPPTEHTRIKVGQGVCGTAVAEGRDQVVRTSASARTTSPAPRPRAARSSC